MTMKAQHTATPWYTRHGQISSEISSHGCTIANCNATTKGISDKEVEANANFIVTACNCHDELLKAVKAAFDWSCERSETGRKWTGRDQMVHDQLAAALRTEGSMII